MNTVMLHVNTQHKTCTHVSAWYLHANVAKGYTYGVEQYYYAGVHPSNRDTANRRPVLRSVTVEERAFALRWLTQRFSCCVRRQCTHTFGEAADTASRYAAPARNWPM